MQDRLKDTIRAVREQRTQTAGVYPLSIRQLNDGLVFTYQDTDVDYLIAVDDISHALDGERFELDGESCTIARFGHSSAEFLRKKFPFTAPIPVLKQDRSIGLGDRLGVATPGHIDAVSAYDVAPVFAQQSMRELKLTGRTYEQVLDAATHSVFCAGFERGFGADGDHLKSAEEISSCLQVGYTMITLDCSEHIRNDVAGMSDEQINAICSLPDTLSDCYLGKSFDVGSGISILLDEMTLKRAFLIYGEVIAFAENIFKNVISQNASPIDFEISIDETVTPTLPQHHFFVAYELRQRQVDVATIAPRFCGEFQKGIDYIGDLLKFEQELKIHAAIAEHFGYKLSIHSGSDKFSLFSMIGKHTNGRYHLKTAGTSWLEAMRLVAMKDACLYREIHRYALQCFNEATKLYKVKTDLTKIPDVDLLSDETLPDLFTNDDARQLIHITYGHILTANADDGTRMFSQKLFCLWRSYGTEYSSLLRKHIGKHLALLYSEA